MFERTMIISPHFDDETIGCGGLIAKVKEQGYEVRVLVLANTDGAFQYSAGRVVDNHERYEESLRALKHLGCNEEELVQIVDEEFRDCRLDDCPMKSLVHALDIEIRKFKPTAVLFPYSSHHQDHQAVYRASIAALRSTVATDYIQLKAMYEYPYINTWSSNVNTNSKIYVPLTEEEMTKKINALNAYKSQLDREPLDPLSVNAIHQMAKSHGIEVCRPYAEVFYPMSIILEELD